MVRATAPPAAASIGVIVAGWLKRPNRISVASRRMIIVSSVCMLTVPARTAALSSWSYGPLSRSSRSWPACAEPTAVWVALASDWTNPPKPHWPRRMSVSRCLFSQLKEPLMAG